MNTLDISAIDPDIRDYFEEMVRIRRHIHSYPEIGPEQPETVKYIKDIFIGMEDVTIIEGDPKAGLVVDIGCNAPGPTVAFRADMDALEVPETPSEDHVPNRMDFRSKYENRMHACGHDVHTAILAGFGKIIHEHRGTLRGTIRLLFQPGEEGHGGGKRMVEAGYLDDVLNVFALHCWPNLAVGQIGFRKGPIFAALDYFSVTIHGIGGHGAAPERASDQILAMSRIINDLQSIVTRRISGFEPAVLSVGYVEAGSPRSRTVIPSTAQFKGSVRTFNHATQETIEKEFKNVCNHSALSVHPECTVDIDYEHIYPLTVNDEHLSTKLGEILSTVIGKHNVFNDFNPTLGGEDFSFMANKAPGVLFLLGGTSPEKLSDKTVFLHHPAFDVDERSMLYGVQAFKSLTIDLLS